jgi:hypothetical protein
VEIIDRLCQSSVVDMVDISHRNCRIIDRIVRIVTVFFFGFNLQRTGRKENDKCLQNEKVDKHEIIQNLEKQKLIQMPPACLSVCLSLLLVVDF